MSMAALRLSSKQALYADMLASGDDFRGFEIGFKGMRSLPVLSELSDEFICDVKT